MSGSPIRRLLGLPVAESLAMLIAASVAIRWASFKRLAAMGQEPRADLAPATAAEAVRIRDALDGWGRRLPWRTLCFEKGLAARWMLRRRGLAGTLYYGAATIAGELKAHVWVRSGEVDVIGCDNARDYALLATFPADPRVSDRSRAKR